MRKSLIFGFILLVLVGSVFLGSGCARDAECKTQNVINPDGSQWGTQDSCIQHPGFFKKDEIIHCAQKPLITPVDKDGHATDLDVKYTCKIDKDDTAKCGCFSVFDDVDIIVDDIFEKEMLDQCRETVPESAGREGLLQCLKNLWSGKIFE